MSTDTEISGNPWDDLYFTPNHPDADQWRADIHAEMAAGYPEEPAMTQPLPPAEHDAPLLALTADEAQAVIKGALIFYAGEGAMDGDTYHALHDALVKLFPAKPATEVKP